MSEQVLDVQAIFSIMRRHRGLLAGLALLGALAGAAVVQVRPPMYSSSSQVLLPTVQSTNSNQSGRDTSTDIRVAMSDVVLGPAGQQMKPQMSSIQVRKHVSVSGATSNVLTITAHARTPHQAEDLATAVAQAEVSYQAQAASSLTAYQQSQLQQRSDALKQQLNAVGKELAATKTRMNQEPTGSKAWHGDATAVAQLTAQQGQLALQVNSLVDQLNGNQSGQGAQVIQAASPAKRADRVVWTVILALLGALLALGISTMVLTVRRRGDRRLRTRDEVADAIGSAVIGSVRTRPQRAAAGWSALMEGYNPSVTDSWSLRQALDHVGLGDLTMRSANGDDRPARNRVLTLITLSDDPRGLAVGPQLASHAASLGLQTRLVAKQGHESSTSLWAACSALRRTDEVRAGLFVDTRRRKGGDDLTIEMIVVDRRHPQFVDLDPSAVTLLAVASSSATAEDLARTAVAAYEAGGRISGVIVADPDSLDRTTGRLLLQQRSEQVHLPTRMTGVDSPVVGDQGGRSGR